MTQVSCFFSEFFGTAVLAFMIIAATDKNNAAPPLVILPFVIFLTMLGLGIAFGMQTGTQVFLLRVAHGIVLRCLDADRHFRSICLQSGARLWAASVSQHGWLRKGGLYVQKVRVRRDADSELILS